MKRKDIIVLIIALVVVMGAGYLYISQSSPKSAAKAVKTAEVVPVITGRLDADNTLANLQTKFQVRDYKQAFDTELGLDNSAPFAR